MTKPLLPILSHTAMPAMLGMITMFTSLPPAQAAVPVFHFDSICRSDPAVNKNLVTLTLHDDYHIPLQDVTINALWTYVDYRQNHAVFRYKLASCTTNRDGICTFSGGNGRARWQLSEVVGFDMGTPAFDTTPTTLCPNSLMIDFW